MPAARTPQDKSSGLTPKDPGDLDKAIELLAGFNSSLNIGKKGLQGMRKEMAELTELAGEFQKYLSFKGAFDLKTILAMEQQFQEIAKHYSDIVTYAKGLYSEHLLSEKVLKNMLEDEQKMVAVQDNLSKGIFNKSDQEFLQNMLSSFPAFSDTLENVATTLSGNMSQLSKIITEINVALSDTSISKAAQDELEAGKKLLEGLNFQNDTADKLSKKLLDASQHLEKATGMKGFEKSSALTTKAVLDAAKGSKRMAEDFKENADNVSKIQKAMTFMGGVANVAGAKTAGGAIQGLGGLAQTAMGASPWGAVIGALAGVAAAIVEFTDENKREGRELRRALTYAGGNLQYIPEAEMGRFSKALQSQLQTAFPWLSDKSVFEGVVKELGTGMSGEAMRGGLPEDFDKQTEAYAGASQEVKKLEDQIAGLRSSYIVLSGNNIAAAEAMLRTDKEYQKLSKELEKARKSQTTDRTEVSKTTSDIMKMYLSMSEKYGISVDALLSNFEVMRRAYGVQLRDIKTAGERYEFLDYKMAKFSITAKASEFNLQDWMGMLIPSSQRLKNFGLTIDDTNALMFQFGDRIHDNILSIDDLVSSIQEGLGGAFNPNKWAIVLQTLESQGMYAKSPVLQRLRTLDPMKQMAMLSAAVEGGAAGQNLLQQSPAMLNFFKSTFGDKAEEAFSTLGSVGKEAIQELREGTAGPFQGQGSVMSMFLSNITGFGKDFGTAAQTWTEGLAKQQIDITKDFERILPGMVEKLAGTLHAKDIQFQSTVTESLGKLQTDFRSVVVGNKLQVEVTNTKETQPQTGERAK